MNSNVYLYKSLSFSFFENLIERLRLLHKILYEKDPDEKVENSLSNIFSGFFPQNVSSLKIEYGESGVFIHDLKRFFLQHIEDQQRRIYEMIVLLRDEIAEKIGDKISNSIKSEVPLEGYGKEFVATLRDLLKILFETKLESLNRIIFTLSILDSLRALEFIENIPSTESEEPVWLKFGGNTALSYLYYSFLFHDLSRKTLSNINFVKYLISLIIGIDIIKKAYKVSSESILTSLLLFGKASKQEDKKRIIKGLTTKIIKLSKKNKFIQVLKDSKVFSLGEIIFKSFENLNIYLNYVQNVSDITSIINPKTMNAYQESIVSLILTTIGAPSSPDFGIYHGGKRGQVDFITLFKNTLFIGDLKICNRRPKPSPQILYMSSHMKAPTIIIYLTPEHFNKNIFPNIESHILYLPLFSLLNPQLSFSFLEELSNIYTPLFI